MHSSVAGDYRKLAIWGGPFDEFAYIDTSHSDIPGIQKFVWRELAQLRRHLSEKQVGFSANPGFIVSKASEISLAKMEADLERVLQLRSCVELTRMELPLLNYLIVTCGRPFTRLRQLNRENPFACFPEERWAGGRIGLVRDWANRISLASSCPFGPLGRTVARSGSTRLS